MAKQFLFVFPPYLISFTLKKSSVVNVFLIGKSIGQMVLHPLNTLKGIIEVEMIEIGVGKNMRNGNKMKVLLSRINHFGMI